MKDDSRVIKKSEKYVLFELFHSSLPYTIVYNTLVTNSVSKLNTITIDVDNTLLFLLSADS